MNVSVANVTLTACTNTSWDFLADENIFINQTRKKDKCKLRLSQCYIFTFDTILIFQPSISANNNIMLMMNETYFHHSFCSVECRKSASSDITQTQDNS